MVDKNSFYMKNTVDAIICSFSKEELREFRYFLLRRDQNTEAREDLKVVDMIRSQKIIQPENISAYRQTKNRLKAQLELFIELENVKRNPIAQIQNQIEVARFLFAKHLYDHAWDYLFKAEQLAIRAEEYELLNHIYYIQILYSYNIAVPPPKAFSVPKLLEKRKQNLSYAHTDSNANAAYALLMHEMGELFSKKLTGNIDELVNNILHDYQLTEVMYDHIRIYCKIVVIVSRALREKRDYVNMKNYTIKTYLLLEEKHMLDKVPLEFMMDLLDAIGVAALRSKDYENTEKYQQLYTFYAHKFRQQPQVYSYYDFILYIGDADLYMCTNRLPEAREELLKVYRKYASYKDSIRIYFLLRVNVLAMYFKCREYSSCIRIFNEIMSQNEKKILNERGFRLELMLYTELYGAIYYYENEDADHAHYMLGKIKKKYAKALQSDETKRESLLIRIMEKMINTPGYLKSKAFASDYKAFVRLKEFVPGDYEYISLNAWLTSKFTGKTYYECFLDLVQK